MDRVLRVCRSRVSHVGLFLGLLIPALIPATASAVGFRTCRHADGAVSMDQSWIVNPPYRVAISSATAADISRRAGKHARYPVIFPRAVPCAVAGSVATTGVDAWENWPGNSGWMRVTLNVFSQKPNLGRFHCSGRDNSAGTAWTCTHTANRQMGRIVVKFEVEQADQSGNPCNQPGAC